MTDEHRRERGIATRGEHSDAVSDRPDDNPGDPLLEAEADRRGKRGVEDREPARRAAEQDRCSEAPMDRDLEARHMAVFERSAHAISAPPPNEKNDRKKLDAANAIERPNTIWIRRRKPPAVSPNASVRPVSTITATAMILATGP